MAVYDSCGRVCRSEGTFVTRGTTYVLVDLDSVYLVECSEQWCRAFCLETPRMSHQPVTGWCRPIFARLDTFFASNNIGHELTHTHQDGGGVLRCSVSRASRVHVNRTMYATHPLAEQEC